MPEATPVTTPHVTPIVATEVVLLAHVPPGVQSDSVIVDPAHTLSSPPIAAGPVLTVNVCVAEQPVVNA